MDPAFFDRLDDALRSQGPAAAIDALCARLRQEKDYTALFYALLLKRRHELGVHPVPTAPAGEMPESAHAPYEEGIREAARHVGGLLLADGNVPQAWGFFRMIDEPGPVRDALEKHLPGPDEEIQPLVQVAYYEGVHPRKGFDWVLERYGICNAITTLGGQDVPHADEDRRYCVGALVRSLHEELRGRLATEVEAREGAAPPEASAPPGTPGVLRRLMAGRDWLFADDNYHVDQSHLSSVVGFSLLLEPCPEVALARELCDYGRHLTGQFFHAGAPPFADHYPAHDRYLAVVQGEDVEGNLDYFREQADKADPEEDGTYPAEVLVTLLLRLGRDREALQVARRHLAAAEGRRLSCPGVTELCQRVGDHATLAEVARERGDPVHYLAGVLAAKK